MTENAFPEPTGSPGFVDDIKVLFREIDRESMDFAFDLWSYEDVKDNAHAILERLESGSMPCDGSWPAEHVSRFRNWVHADTPP